jgi:hypothetical protein
LGHLVPARKSLATAGRLDTMLADRDRRRAGVLGHPCALFWDARSGTLAVDYVSPVKLGTVQVLVPYGRAKARRAGR